MDTTALKTGMMPAHSASITKMWRVLAMLSAYSLVVAWLDNRFFEDQKDVSSTLFAAFGTVLGLLLVFRTNTAYDRWWEGRKQWGELVNHTRNFSLKLRSLPNVETSESRHVGRLLVNFARALKEHLREGIRARNLSIYQASQLTGGEPEHVPVHIAGQIRQIVVSWRQDGRIDGFTEMVLDVHFRALMDVCGACERIRRTPLVQSYRAFIRRIIGVYMATLPWGVVANFEWWAFVVVVPVGYFMIGLERIAEEVEEPFGRGEDDLLLDDYVRGIDKVVGEIFQDQSIKIPTSV